MWFTVCAPHLTYYQLLLLCLRHSPPISPLFPYTTLFRSMYTSTPDQTFILERRGRVVIGSPCSGHGFKFAHDEPITTRSEEHTSELQSRRDLVCRRLLEKKTKVPACWPLGMDCARSSCNR